jgi:hypothetical protein
MAIARYGNAVQLAAPSFPSMLAANLYEMLL